MEDFETTSPVDGEALPETEIQEKDVATGAGASTSSARADEDQLEATINELGDNLEDDESDEERFEEIERNGKKATIPVWLKPELMMQADYTRKTQELAEARRAFEAEREAVQQMSEAELSVVANLNNIDRQMDQFSKTDWNAWNDSDPAAAQKAFGRFQFLKDARREALAYLESLGRERTAIVQREAAKRFGECVAELERDVQDWSPQLAAKLFDFGQRHYGFSAKELRDIDNPRAIKALHAAYQWEEHQAKQRLARRHAAAQEAKPAAKVGGAAPKPGLDDRLSPEEWRRRRNGQLRSRG